METARQVRGKPRLRPDRIQYPVRRPWRRSRMVNYPRSERCPQASVNAGTSVRRYEHTTGGTMRSEGGPEYARVLHLDAAHLTLPPHQLHRRSSQRSVNVWRSGKQGPLLCILLIVFIVRQKLLHTLALCRHPPYSNGSFRKPPKHVGLRRSCAANMHVTCRRKRPLQGSR
jgi:hypothetical protein